MIPLHTPSWWTDVEFKRWNEGRAKHWDGHHTLDKYPPRRIGRHEGVPAVDIFGIPGTFIPSESADH